MLTNKLYDVVYIVKEDPKNYALHTPMPFSRPEMKKSLELTKDLPMSLRSFYANYFNVGGIEGPDCKVFRLGGV